MGPVSRQRIVDCLEACRCFGNPAALPAVLDALADLLIRIDREPAVTSDSREVAQLRAALDCLDLHPPEDVDAN